VRERGLCLGLLAFACSTAPAPLVTLPRPALTPAAATRPVLAPTVAVDNGPAATELVSIEPSQAAPLAPPPSVLIEPPYSALGHRRLATEMLTLGRDEELLQWALGGTANPEHPSNRPGYHPATRVVVDVELLSRAPKGSTRRLLATARSSSYWPLRSCFETAQRLAPKSERSARVRLTLGAGGKALGARSIGPSAERDYARCVLERVRALDFTPGFTRKLDVEISLKQWPGHAPLPPHAPDDTPPLRLSKTAQASLQNLTPALASCYQAGLSGDPKLWGRIALRLKLGEGGSVQEATQVETRFPSAAVVDCARQVLLGARLGDCSVSELTFAVRLGAQGAPPAPAVPLAPPLPMAAPASPPPPDEPVGPVSPPPAPAPAEPVQ
jgi:hypothetical protein